MMNTLISELGKISPLSSPSKAILAAHWKQWDLPKGHMLLRAQSVSDYFYFIEKGIARIYYTKEDKEITEWIAMEKTFFFSITSFFERTPSHLAIHTIEPALVFGIHHNDFMELADTNADIEKLLRKMITLSLIKSQERMKSLQFETAQQRYENIADQFPQFIQRVPLNYIASFLGVTQETISRIRANRL